MPSKYTQFLLNLHQKRIERKGETGAWSLFMLSLLNILIYSGILGPFGIKMVT